jgi:hypothetical protein
MVAGNDTVAAFFTLSRLRGRAGVGALAIEDMLELQAHVSPTRHASRGDLPRKRER